MRDRIMYINREIVDFNHRNHSIEILRTSVIEKIVEKTVIPIRNNSTNVPAIAIQRFLTNPKPQTNY